MLRIAVLTLRTWPIKNRHMDAVLATTRIAVRNILFAADFDVSSGRALPFAVALRDPMRPIYLSPM